MNLEFRISNFESSSNYLILNLDIGNLLKIENCDLKIVQTGGLKQ